MRVAVVGGTGFVGSYLVDALIDAGHDVAVLIRPGSHDKIRGRKVWRATYGDVSDSSALDALVDGCDAAIYNIGILRAFPKKGITFEKLQHQGAVGTIDAAERAGVKRFLLMSANGVVESGTPYQATKFHAEQALWESGLDGTVFRPSVIFGDPRGQMEIATQLHRDMVRPPVPAVGFYRGLRPGGGALMMSPIFVEDVAAAFLNALDDPGAVGQTFTLGGPDSLSWTQMIGRVAAATGRRKLILPMPIFLMKIAATLFDWIPAFPVTRDQLTMLAEGNVADPATAKMLADRALTPFDNDSLAYLRTQ